jgi:hypothetical protein
MCRYRLIIAVKRHERACQCHVGFDLLSNKSCNGGFEIRTLIGFYRTQENG